MEERDNPTITEQSGTGYVGGSRRYHGSMGKGNLPWTEGLQRLLGGSKVKGEVGWW